MSECTPTEADREDAKLFLIGLSLDGTDETPQSLPAEGVDDIVAELAALFAKVRADERAKVRADERAKVRADERAKRPDREQIERTVRAHRVWWNFETGSLCQCGWKCLLSEHPAHVADAVLALEPEAREEKPPAYLASDLWSALRLPDAEFDGYYERNGWADTWSNLLAEVRLRSGARPCGQDADGEPCVLMTESHLVHYGASDVGSSEPLPAPEAREEAELFHDQDGDLWKLTDKGEWFHEEEPGEFRQVLSIDAEDQTLTPVGRAELAPDAEVAREVE